MDGQAERKEWIGRVMVGVRAVLSLAGRRTAVPLAWRNMLADKRRLLRSTSGIAFAVLLMLLQLGFRGAFFDSAVGVIRNIDGDILLTSSSKFKFGGQGPVLAPAALRGARGRRRRVGAADLCGMDNFELEESANSQDSTPPGCWRSIRTSRCSCFQRSVSISRHCGNLTRPSPIGEGVASSASRAAGTLTELSRREIRIIGNFALGPDFSSDGTVITSDRTFLKVPRSAQAGGRRTCRC